jgi:hypothetical protein
MAYKRRAFDRETGIIGQARKKVFFVVGFFLFKWG